LRLQSAPLGKKAAEFGKFSCFFNDHDNIQALEQLTGKQKEVIFLRYFEELSYEEISAMTNISVKGLYKLNNRAMEALKDIMGMPKQNLLVLLYMIKFLYS